MTIATTIETLRDEIRFHDRLYYCEGVSEITDTEYDKLLQQLVRLEAKHPEHATPDSPTQRVAGEPVEGFTKHKHTVPMMSVDNSFDFDGLDRFHARMTAALGYEPKYCVDYKIDGCAVTLIYEDGMLQQAATRGDGKTGDDITHNVRAMPSVPSKLFAMLGGLPEGRTEIRGEAYIGHADFLQVQDAQHGAGEEPYANSRNATAGAIRQLDPKECFRRKVRFVAHGFGGTVEGHADIPTHSEQMAIIRAHAIPTIDGMCGSLTYTQARKHIDLLVEKMGEIDYPIDGIVLKLDRFADREIVGQSSSKYVSWAVAYKWERYEAETTVESIQTQIGKRGTITPVVYLKPVEIAETMVKKATLFNFDEVLRLNICVGDKVVVEKAGKIIPHVVRVLHDQRDPAVEWFPMHRPVRCADCGTALVNEGAYLRCPNSQSCPEQLKAAILAAAGRTYLDIDGLGDVLVGQLVDSGLVTQLADLWRLKAHTEAMAAFPKIGKKKVAKLLAALEAAKERPSWRLLASLNIPHVGRTASEKIMDKIGDLGALGCTLCANHGLSTIRDIEGIGREIATSLLAWFANPLNQDVLVDFRELGLNMGERDPKEEVVAGPQPLAGKKVCATGKLQGFSRATIKDAIKAAGGTASSSVSKSLDYLVVGEDAGSKLAKARDLGVETLTEEQFNALCAS